MGQQFRDAEAIYFAARREGKKYTGSKNKLRRRHYDFFDLRSSIPMG
jgi:hypothetical protein